MAKDDAQPPPKFAPGNPRFDDGSFHFEPEKRQSGSLPDQPVDNPADAAPGNATPWKNLTNGR